MMLNRTEKKLSFLGYVMPKGTGHLWLCEQMLEIYIYRYNMEHYSLKLLVSLVKLNKWVCQQDVPDSDSRLVCTVKDCSS